MKAGRQGTKIRVICQECPEVAVLKHKAVKGHEVGRLLNIPKLQKGIILLLQAATACDRLCVQTDGTDTK